MKTVAIQFWGRQIRDAGFNRPTVVAPRPLPTAYDVKQAFLRAYAKFADACRAVDEPGVALIAVDEVTGDPAGMLTLRARVDRSVCAIVGRHDRCDLYLTGHDQLALRQLALIISPLRSWRAGSSDVSFRVLDLRASNDMLDEQGRPLRGLRSEGPTFVRCGSYLLLALPLGDHTDWPASADDAWSYLPERVYFDELVKSADGSVVSRPPARDPGVTRIVRLAGPAEPGSLAPREEVAGELVIAGPMGKAKLEVTRQALRNGVLLGRYARCDGAGLAADDSISRVHLLIVLDGDRLLAIDAASTNGTRRPGDVDVRVIELADGSELELGTTTTLHWRWVS